MAILIEALAVVVPCEAIVKKFAGGVESFLASLPNKTLCSDGELSCVTFMVPKDVQKYVEYLVENGLTFKDNNESVDIVVVDQIHGKTSACDWADFGKTDWNNNPDCPISVCCARPTKTKKVFVPDGWRYDKSLSANYKYVDGKEEIPENLKFVRSEDGIDVLFNNKTGQEFYIRRG